MSGPVVGTDGKVPVYDPNGRWCWWSINEIFQENSPGQNRYVPKVNDYVIDPETYTVWIVEAIDPVTLYSTLREIRPANMSHSVSETDILFGVGPGTQSDTYRVYVDKSVTPYVMAVDSRLKVGGSMCSYAKIFKGSVLDAANGHVVSKVYDSAGNFVSENVPLELIAIDSHNNYSIKTVSVCNVTEDLLDGEVVTVVFYNDRGHVVSKRQLLVENTAFIRSLNSSRKYVTHISLDCAFMSPTFDNIIEFPLNIPLNALNLMGKVHYSNGDTFEYPVDGTKFKMHGLDQYVSSIIGQKIPLVLNYSLSPDEIAYASVGVESLNVTEPYDLVTVNPNNSYTVKLFGYPFFIDEATGYQMRWWMFNLERNVYFEVTPYVNFDTNTGPYDPKGYGYMQRKSVSINLRNVSGAFKNFVHTQLVEIVLNSPPGVQNPAWTMSHESNVNRPMYGIGLFAKKKTNQAVNLGSNIADLAEWKTKVYKNTFPLIDPRTELQPVEPTHFVVTYNNISTEYAIANWNQDINIGNDIEIFKTISIRFIRRMATEDLQLAISAMLIMP